MAHSDPDDHTAAMKTFLNDWTPLTLKDRAKAFQDGPGVLFIDGDEYAARPVSYVEADLPSDDAEVFDLTLEGTRNTSAVVVKRGDEILHRFEDDVGETITLDRVDDPDAYTVAVQDEESGGWRVGATVGVERNPKKHLPDGRYYGAVVQHGGEMEEEFGREVVAKYRHDAVKSWTHARYIVVGDATQRSAIPDDVLLNPTDHEYDQWFNAFYTDYRDIGWCVLEMVLWPDWWPRNLPYVVICVS